MPNLTDEQWERMKLAVDELDSLTTGLTVMTTIPDRTHVTALRGTLPNVVTELKAVVEDIDG